MKNLELAKIFEDLAELLEFKGENPFKLRAYHNAARSIEAVEEDLETIIHEALHLAVPALPERVVGYASRYIAKILWHLQYRADEDWQEEHYTSEDLRK